MRGPSGEVECRLNLTPTGGSGSFIPTEVGMHEVRMTLSRVVDIPASELLSAAATAAPTSSSIVSDGVLRFVRNDDESF